MRSQIRTRGLAGPFWSSRPHLPPIGKYYAEILRTEGLNEFAVSDIGTVTADDARLLRCGYPCWPMTLTRRSGHYVYELGECGGNLIAMRPDPQLDSLLGLTSTAANAVEQLLAVDTSTPAGSGIVSQPMQFHGTAGAYTLNGASGIATLYTNPTTATSNPAVTVQ